MQGLPSSPSEGWRPIPFFHGSSETDAVQCDRTKPVCQNCIRQGYTCPGYGDVFDCAHRPQNHVVRDPTRSQHTAADGERACIGEINLGTKPSAELVPRASSGATATNVHKASQRWIVYSTNSGHPRSSGCAIDLPKDCSPAEVQERNLDTFSSPVPCALK